MSSSKHPPITDQLIQYEALAPPLKTIVRILAANMDFCRQHTIHDTVAMMVPEWYSRREWSGKTVSTHVKTLVDKGLIVKNPKGVCCEESIRMDVIHDMILTDEFEEAASVLQRVLPVKRDFNGRRDFRTYREVLRELLFTAFSYDSDETPDEIIADAKYRFLHEMILSDPCMELFNQPFNPVIMDHMRPAARFRVLERIALTCIGRLLPGGEVMDYYEEHAFDADNEDAANGILVYLLLKGETERAEEIIRAYLSSPNHEGFFGWLEFIKGNNDRALAHFDDCITVIRRKTKKRVLHINGPAGMFHLLALLKSGAPDNFKQALERIKSAGKSRNQSTFDYAMCQMAPLFKDGLSDNDLLETLKYTKSEPLLAFIMMLAHWWLEREEAASHLPLLLKLRDRTESGGYRWLTAELSGLLSAQGQSPAKNRKNADELHARCGSVSCVDIVKEVPLWEKTLKALIDIGRGGGESAENHSDQRLVWLVSHGEEGNVLDFTPRLQKKTKKGEWTKGRAVAMKTLANDNDTMAGLTDQDRRVCSAITESYYNNSYGYYGRSVEYDFDDSKALPALCGHPLLFLEENPGVKAELVMGEPEVRFIKKRGKIELKMTPMPSLYFRQDVMVVKDTPTRFKVVRMEEAHRRIASLVGKGMTVPKEAESMAVKAVESLSAMVTIHSDLAGGESVTDVSADPQPHLHLMPHESGIRVEFLVKPFDAKGPSFKPGKGGKNVLAGVGGKKIQAVRDLKEEKKRADKVIAACPTLGGLEALAWEFVTEDPEESLELLLELKACDNDHVMQWPRGEKLKVSSEADFTALSLVIKKDRDWFKATGRMEISEKLSLDLKQLLTIMEGSIGRFIPLDDGSFLALTDEFKKRLEELRDFSSAHGKGLRFPPLAAPALSGLTENLESVEGDKAWKDHCKRLSRITSPKVPGTLQASLRDYQTEGFNWLARLSGWGMGACLADDMGLGKTVQAIAAVLLQAAKGPTLVVAPLSVMANWEEECRRFAPTLNVSFFGPGDRKQALSELGPFDLMVSSYGRGGGMANRCPGRGPGHQEHEDQEKPRRHEPFGGKPDHHHGNPH